MVDNEELKILVTRGVFDFLYGVWLLSRQQRGDLNRTIVLRTRGFGVMAHVIWDWCFFFLPFVFVLFF